MFIILGHSTQLQQAPTYVLMEVIQIDTRI